MSRLAVVTPTRNRPEELTRLLRNLRAQSLLPAKVVVVDGSDPAADCESVTRREGGCLDVHYLRHWPPSAAAQRNAGIAAVTDTAELIALIDDDVLLEPRCFENALCQIQKQPMEYIGFGLNRMDAKVAKEYGRLKVSRLAQRLGLYSDRMGMVMPSGWHTRFRSVSVITEVEWIPSEAAIWRTSALLSLRFDDFFERYSYLEDLDFSLEARRLGRMMVLPDARYEHHPASGGRGTSFWFGQIELRNRCYIVVKHRLSRSRFLLGVFIRMAMTVGEVLRGRGAALGRLAGNIVELPRLLGRRASFSRQGEVVRVSSRDDRQG